MERHVNVNKLNHLDEKHPLIVTYICRLLRLKPPMVRSLVTIGCSNREKKRQRILSHPSSRGHVDSSTGRNWTAMSNSRSLPKLWKLLVFPRSRLDSWPKILPFVSRGPWSKDIYTYIQASINFNLWKFILIFHDKLFLQCRPKGLHGNFWIFKQVVRGSEGQSESGRTSMTR